MKAELIDYLGNDDRVVDAARVSFAKIAENYTQEQNDKLIKYLSDHNHWSPFAHCVITMRETVPIFIARQRFKHTIGFSYNEVSRRYVDDTPEFFIPEGWRLKAENKKQGSSEESHPDQDFIDSAVMSIYKDIEHLYGFLLGQGIAPEQARMVLPQSMYTSYYVTGSLSAFARAYKLRSESYAQKEIQDLAKQWDALLRPLYPVSWSALVD